MRITNSMMSDQFLSDANASLNRLAKAQEQVDSTKRINNIDDDPLATLTSMKARNKLSSLAEYQNSIKTVNSSLKENENTVDSLNTVVKSAYELIVSANSGSKSESELGSIADEIEGLRDEVLSDSNATLGTVYLFNGDSSKTPFSVDQSTGHLTYNGLDLTAFALQDDVADTVDKAKTAQATLFGTGTDDPTSLEYGLNQSDTGEYYAKNTLCPDILNQLDTMIAQGTQATQYAKQYGDLDTSDLTNVIGTLTSFRDSLESANSKTLSSDLIAAGTVDEGDTDSLTRLGYSLSSIRSMIHGDSSVTPPVEGLSSICSTFMDKMNSLKTDMTVSDATTLKSLGVESVAHKQLQVGSTQTVDMSINGLQLLGVDVSVERDPNTNAITGGKTQNSNLSNVYYVLDKCAKALRGELDSSVLKEMSTTLQSVQSDLLSVDTKIGTQENRLSLLSSRYTASNLTYKEMQSNAEDADMASAVVELTSAKTAYNAALAAGAKIVQTSLIDFLR